MNARTLAAGLLLLLLLAPWAGLGRYPLHLMVMAVLWAYIYTSWAIMGRLGMVSFGHGAFMGVGAYAVVLSWNLFGVSPWVGALLGIAATIVLAVVIGYPCFRFRIVGHYFALVTLALSEVVRLVIVALRDQTGGSLGITPRSALGGTETYALGALQFDSKVLWFYIMVAFWLLALWVWQRVDRSMTRLALQAISEEEDAAASIGIPVNRSKLAITVLSAVMTCIGGVLYAQYQLYISPETVSGISISLQMVFGAIAGGMFVLLGPTFGAVFLLVLSEVLRVLIGNQAHGVDQLIYGLLLVLFIIFMPEGILGAALKRFSRAPAAVDGAAGPGMGAPGKLS